MKIFSSKHLAPLTVAIAVASFAGCGGESIDVDDSTPVTQGKSDDTTEQPEVTFDEEDPAWQEVTECSGYDLCLDVLVVGRDLTDPESQRFFPMQRVIDELFFVDDLVISPNCAAGIAFDSDENLACVPDEGEPFLFGSIVGSDSSIESGWGWNTYDYESLERARLFKYVDPDTEEVGAYYLDLR